MDQNRWARAGKALILVTAALDSRHILLAYGNGQERIAPQIGMVVVVLVNQFHR